MWDCQHESLDLLDNKRVYFDSYGNTTLRVIKCYLKTDDELVNRRHVIARNNVNIADGDIYLHRKYIINNVGMTNKIIG